MLHSCYGAVNGPRDGFPPRPTAGPDATCHPAPARTSRARPHARWRHHVTQARGDRWRGRRVARQRKRRPRRATLPPTTRSAGLGERLALTGGLPRGLPQDDERHAEGGHEQCGGDTEGQVVTTGQRDRLAVAAGQRPSGTRGGQRSSVRAAASVDSTATPVAIPICWVVLNSPEARPASSAVAPDMPSVVSAGSTRPAPR